MAEFADMNPIKDMAREMAEREFRHRQFEAQWTGSPEEFAKAWYAAEHERILRWIPRARALSLRQRLQVIERCGNLIRRLDRWRQFHAPSHKDIPS